VFLENVVCHVCHGHRVWVVFADQHVRVRFDWFDHAGRIWSMFCSRRRWWLDVLLNIVPGWVFVLHL
jgi:hypothetical protein